MIAKSRLPAGDTIVEVLVSVVVAGLVLGIAYSLSNSALRTGTSASQRSQALAVGSAQIERLKVAYFKDPSSFSAPASNFCLSADGTVNYTNVAGNCINFENSMFTPIDSFDSTNGVGGTYTISVTWTSVNGSGNDNLKLYYRLP